MAEATKGTKTGDQISAAQEILGLVNLFKRTGGGTTTEVTSTSGVPNSEAAVQSAINDMLTGTRGLAATAQGQKSAGLFNSSSNKLLTGNLLAKAAGAGATVGAANAPRTTTRSMTAPTAKAALSSTDAALLGTAYKAANSETGKKLISDAGSYLSGLFTSDAPASFGVLSSDAGAGAVTDWGAGTSFWDTLGSSAGESAAFDFTTAGVGAATDAATDTAGTSLWDGVTSLFGYAEGGRVPKNIHSASPFTDPVRTVMQNYTAVSSPTSTADVSGTAATAGSAMAGPGSFSALSLGAAQNLASVGTNFANTLGAAAVNAVAPGFGMAFGPTMGLTGGKAAMTETMVNGLMTGNIRGAMDVLAEHPTSKSAADYLAGLGIDPATGGYYGGNAPAGFVSGGQNLVGTVAPGNPVTNYGFGANAGTDISGETNQNQFDVSSGNPLGPGVSVTQNADGSFTMSGGNAMGYSQGASPDSGYTGTADQDSQDAMSAFNTGGRVKGDKKLGVDDVNAKLDGGEVVIKARSVQLIDKIMGPEFLDKLNRISDGVR